MTAAIAVLGAGVLLGCELTIYRFSLWGRQKQIYRALGVAGAATGIVAALIAIARVVTA